jgi:class 3 adenylate cyclase
VLATVLFTDIVGSTEKAVALGDNRRRDLLDSHHATIRRNLKRFRGNEVKSTGDGILATFDGPARGSAAPAPLPRRSGHTGLLFAPASIQASAK